MTYDELLRLFQDAGGTFGTTYQGAMGEGADYNASAASQPGSVYIPGIGTIQPDQNGGLMVANRFDGGAYGAGGSEGYTVAPGGSAQPFRYDDPERNPLNANGLALVGGFALPGLAAQFMPALAGAGGAGGGSAASAALPMVDDWAAAGSLLSANPATIAPAAAGLGAELNPYVGLGAGGGTGAALAGGAGTAASNALRGATGSGMDWMSLLSNPALLAAGAGAVAGIAGNDDITQSQSNTASGSQGLADWMRPFAQDYLGRAQSLANAPTSNATMDAGRGVLSDLATQGDPLVNAARSQQQNVIGGGLLNSNPYIDGVANSIGQRMGDAYAVGTRANTASRFNNDGNSVGAKSAFGQTNFMNDRAFADSLGSTMNNLYFGNYQQERAAQDAASRGSLGFGTFAGNNAQTAYNVGAQDWMRPFAQNQQFGQAINPAFGSQTSTSGTQNQTINAPNNWMAGLGGAAMGAGIWNMFNPTRRS